MKPSHFDKLGGVFLALIFGFSAGVAVADWDWFPTGEWGDIAHIPPNALNYTALLLPWITLLIFLMLRRRRGGGE